MQHVKKRPERILLLFFFLLPLMTLSQTRLNEYNTIGWYTTTATVHLNPRWSVHGEYQWRRNNLALTWQQSLLRTGINYHINPDAVVRLGYGWIETYPYGTYPLQAAGKQFTEHRIYQTLTLNHSNRRFSFSHRYMLEQRWVANYLNAASTEPDTWNYLNRFRYMGRAQLFLNPETENARLYAAVYDEVFIGFGEKVGQNVFDQNRLGILLGWKFSDRFRIEGGYLQQIVQLGRRVGTQNVFQYNNGLIINTFWNF